MHFYCVGLLLIDNAGFSTYSHWVKTAHSYVTSSYLNCLLWFVFINHSPSYKLQIPQSSFLLLLVVNIFDGEHKTAVITSYNIKSQESGLLIKRRTGTKQLVSTDVLIKPDNHLHATFIDNNDISSPQLTRKYIVFPCVGKNWIQPIPLTDQILYWYHQNTNNDSAIIMLSLPVEDADYVDYYRCLNVTNDITMHSCSFKRWWVCLSGYLVKHTFMSIISMQTLSQITA